MSHLEFLKPRLIGSRFEGPAIPLELLKDFAALEEMVKEVAKWKLMKEHPDRKRAPKGFTQGTELRLSALESGSAVPTFSLHVEGLPPLTHRTYLESALDTILDVIGAAELGLSVNQLLPKSLLSFFDRFGRGLREGEVLELITSRRSEPVHLTKAVRRRLVGAASIRQITEETTVRGLIPEMDQDNETFEIQTLDGRKIVGPIHPQHADTLRDGFMGYRKQVRVQVQGIGRFSPQGKLETFESIEHVVCLDPLDIQARLDELKLLRNGWLDGQAGRTLETNGLEWLRRAFEGNYPDDLPLPYLYPTAEGGVQVEWTLGTREITLEVDLASKTGVWHELDLGSDDETTTELDLTKSTNWQWLADQLR